MTMQPSDDRATAEQQLAATANAGGDLVVASYLYVAEAITWNLAGAIASGAIAAALEGSA